MTIIKLFAAALLASAGLSPVAHALEKAEVKRLDPERVEITWSDADPVTVYATQAADAAPDEAQVLARGNRSGKIVVAAPAAERRFFLLRDGGDQSVTRVAERVLPLERGSNFRDVGGYVGAEGRTVKWGRIYRSGAMPMLTEGDFGMLGQLGIGAIVDLRSTDERMIAPDALDDRTGALFLSNDYSLKPLISAMSQGDGEYMYRGMGKLLAPQFRMIFNRLLAEEGAVVYHCSAGQDRTGVATALLLSALGVDRKTILADYHLSTELRRPLNEMPPLNPDDWPGNPIVPYYVAGQKAPGGPKAEPLYTRKGNSHLAQFFEVIDRDYGGVEGYLDKELGIGSAEIAKLRLLYLE